MNIEELGLGLVSAQGQWLSGQWSLLSGDILHHGGRDAAGTPGCLESVPGDMAPAAHSAGGVALHQGRPSHLQTV